MIKKIRIINNNYLVVRYLRFACGFFSILLVILLCWPKTNMQVNNNLLKIEGNLAENIKFFGGNHDSKSYMIQAEKATFGEKSIVNFEKPAALIKDENSNIVIAATVGHLDRDTEDLTLGGKVLVQHSNGLKAETPRVIYNAKLDVATGKEGVIITHNNNSLRANNFEIKEQGNKITLTGKVVIVSKTN